MDRAAADTPCDRRTLGYADGYFRAPRARPTPSAAPTSIVAGERCPIAGRVSMDLIAIDVTDLPENAREAR